MKNIRKFIEKNFTWDLEGYKLPRSVEGSRMGQWIDLEGLRKERLGKPRSGHEAKFIYDISPHGFPFIPEFPLPICNRERWFELMEYFSVPPRFHNFFHVSLDFFFPFSSGIVVEIDGVQHEKQREYDHARDEYLREEYGLKTLRIDQYGDFNAEESEEFLGNLLKDLSEFQSESFFPLDLTSQIENLFMNKYSSELGTMERIREVRGIGRIVKMTNRDFYVFSKGEVYTDSKSIHRFNKLFKSIYNQEVSLVPR